MLIIFLAVYSSPAEDEMWIEVQRGDFIIDLVESGEIQ
ncbi:unnamed protein product, partial [marine sediment metagenome]